MRFLALLTFLAVVSLAYGTDPKDTMCVKLKNGLYKCKASGKYCRENAVLRHP